MAIGVTVELFGKSGSFVRATQSAKAGIANLRAGVNEFANSKAVQFLSGGAILATFTKLGGDALKMAADLDIASKSLGVSTDTLQELGFAAGQFGVEQDKVNQSLRDFGQKLGDARAGTGGMLPILKRYNIALNDANGNARSGEMIIGDLAEAMKNTRDPTDRLYIAMKSFGQGGAGLVPVLEGGKEGLKQFGEQARESGQVLERETIAALANASVEIENFKKRITVAVGEILVNFRTAEGLAALGYGLLEVAARFGGRVIDAVAEAAQFTNSVFVAAFERAVNALQNGAVTAIQAIAEKINLLLPARFEINVGNLDQLRASADDYGEILAQTIAGTKPTAFSDTFGDFWKGLKDAAQAAATTINQTDFPEKIVAAGQAVKADTAVAATTIKEAGKDTGTSIAAGADKAAISLKGAVASLASATNSILNATSNARKFMLGGQSGESLNNLDTATVEEILRRAKRDLADIDRDAINNSALGTALSRTGPERTIQNAERELALREKTLRDVNLGGVDFARRQSTIPPEAFDRLLEISAGNQTDTGEILYETRETNRLLRGKFINQ